MVFGGDFQKLSFGSETAYEGLGEMLEFLLVSIWGWALTPIGPRNLVMVEILIFLWIRSTCKIAEPYNNSFWEKELGERRRDKFCLVKWPLCWLLWPMPLARTNWCKQSGGIADPCANTVNSVQAIGSHVLRHAERRPALAWANI